MEHFTLKLTLLILIIGLHVYAMFYVTNQERKDSSPARAPIRVMIIVSYLIQSVLILNL